MNHKKKIVFVITDYGAFNIFLSELCNYLINNFDYKLYLICSNTKVINVLNKFEFGSKLQIIYIDIPRTINLYKLFKSAVLIRKNIKKINPDLIHAHFTTGIFPTILLKNKGFNTIGTFHGLGFVGSRGYKKIIFFIIEFICFIRLNKIIVLNKKDFEAVPFLFKEKTILSKSLGLGCDLSLFSSEKYTIKNINDLKNDLGINDEFVLAFTGRFVHFKGFHLLIRAFFLLEQEFGSKFKLILMGGVDLSHKTGLSKTELLRLYNSNNIINLGFINNVEKYLALTDLFIFLSKKEGVPISITESLAMGVPVVSLDSRGCNDLIMDQINGFLISENLSDSEIISSCYNIISNIYKNKNILKSLKNNILSDRNKLSRNNFIIENANYYKLDLNT